MVGRLAPSPTGGLHLGHARTFLIAWLAARNAGGRVILRIEDLDASRVRPEARIATRLDLQWLGLDWDEGPDVGGPSAPYIAIGKTTVFRGRARSTQSERKRLSVYLHAGRHPASRECAAPRRRRANLSRHLCRTVALSMPVP